MKPAITARGRMTRLARIERFRATFPKRYATNCKSALRTCAMMQQAGSTERKMDQESFVGATDKGWTKATKERPTTAAASAPQTGRAEAATNPRHRGFAPTGR